jgi:hypothetical protein
MKEYRPRLNEKEYNIILKLRNDNPVQSTQAKILLFDIETAPFGAYAFSKWNDISDNFVLSDWNIICWSAKWLFEYKVYSMKCTVKEQKERNDKRVVEGLWQMLNECDILIAHNLKKFDKKIAQTRFFKHDLKLPSHYQEIDTLLTARKQFKITSNRLDFLAEEFLGIEGKMETEKKLWIKACGNPFQNIDPSEEAIGKMSIYCDQDVRVLEDVYLFLRPYITNHPNVALWEAYDEKICKACGGKEFTEIGEYTTIVNRYEGYRCVSCGSVHRDRKPIEKSKIKLR